MAQPDQQVNMKRVFIWILIFIIAVWIVYAVLGGPSTPKASTASPDSAATAQP